MCIYTSTNVDNKPTKAKRNPRKLRLTSYNIQHKLQMHFDSPMIQCTLEELNKAY